MNYILPETAAERFGLTVEDLNRSRQRGLFPGNTGFTIVAEGGRKLVYPSDLRPEATDTPPTDTVDPLTGPPQGHTGPRESTRLLDSLDNEHEATEAEAT